MCVCRFVNAGHELVDANSIVCANESQDQCCMFPDNLLTYIDIVLCLTTTEATVQVKSSL